MIYKLSEWDIEIYFFEKEPYRATGNVYGNPRFIDGRYITTSAITDYEFDQDNNLIVRTENSRYLLPKESYKGKEYTLTDSVL